MFTSVQFIYFFFFFYLFIQDSIDTSIISFGYCVITKIALFPQSHSHNSIYLFIFSSIVQFSVLIKIKYFKINFNRLKNIHQSKNNFYNCFSQQYKQFFYSIINKSMFIYHIEIIINQYFIIYNLNLIYIFILKLFFMSTKISLFFFPFFISSYFNYYFLSHLPLSLYTLYTYTFVYSLNYILCTLKAFIYTPEAENS